MVKMECNSEVSTIPKYLDSIAFSSDGRLAITASNLTGRLWNGTIAIFSDPKFAPNIPHTDTSSETEAGCSEIKWIDKRRLAVCSDSGAVEVWSLIEDGCLLENSMILLEHDDVCCTMSIDPSRLQIASGSWDGRLKVWDLTVEMSVHTYAVHVDHIHSVAWNQKNPYIMASASEDGTVKIYDSRDVSPASLLCYDDTRYPCSLDWHPVIDSTIAIGYNDGFIQLTDIREPSLAVASYHNQSKNVNKVLFLENKENYLASISDDTSLHIQDYKGGKTIYKDTRHTDYVRGLDWNPVDKKLWTCSWDGKVLPHEIPKGNDETKMEM